MPVEVYEVTTPDTGSTPPAEPAAAGEVNGVPGAPPATPATSTEDAGAPPAPPSPASGEGAGDASDDDDTTQAVTLDDFNRHMARLRQRQRRAERALETERTQYQQELAGLRGQIEVMTRLMQGQSPDLGGPPQPTGPPQAEQYASHEDFVRATARYEAQQVQQSERQQQQVQTFQQDLAAREQAFQQAHPDYQQVVNANLRGKVAPHVQQALMLLPEGPAVAYALAQQPELVTRLNTLPPPLVFAELGRLSPAPATPTPPTTTTTNGAGSPPAPTTPPLEAPLTPVNGQGSAPPGTWRPDMSQEDYRAWRRRTSALETWKNRS